MSERALSCWFRSQRHAACNRCWPLVQAHPCPGVLPAEPYHVESSWRAHHAFRKTLRQCWYQFEGYRIPGRLGRGVPTYTKRRMNSRKIGTPRPTLHGILYPSDWGQHCPRIAISCKSSHRKLCSRPTLQQKKHKIWATTDLCKNTPVFEKHTVFVTFPSSRPTLHDL